MRKKNRVLFAVSTLILLCPLAARAQSDSGLLSVIATNTANTTAGTGTIATEITAGVAEIVLAIQNLQSQEMANVSIAEQASANMAQVVDRQNVATAISAVRLKAIDSANSGYSSCNTIYSGVASQAFTPALLQWKEGLYSMDNDWVTNQKVINGQTVPSGQNLGLTTTSSVNSHCANFAEQSDIDQNICPAGTKLAANPGADMSMGHLFDQLTMDPADASAAQAFLRLTVHPLPLPPLPPAFAASAAGKQEILRRESVTGRLSAAYWLIASGISDRQPLTDDPSLQDWAEGTAKDSGYSPDPTTGKYFPNGVSLDAYDKLRADSWVQDSNFTTALSAGNETSLLKDLVNIEAFRAEMDVEIKQLLEQNNAGMGVLLANSIKTSEQP
jgi:hypothetical protein